MYIPGSTLATSRPGHPDVLAAHRSAVAERYSTVDFISIIPSLCDHVVVIQRNKSAS